MNCNEIRELLPDLAAGMGAATLEPEVEKHIASCSACAAHLGDLQKTMALLDEWQAPEPSPYFDTRMQARLREEMARPAAGWLGWLWRPAWSMSLAAVVFAGALVVGLGGKSYLYQTEAIKTEPPSLGLPVQPGTAVGDLQALERNDELYADFDMLDELQVQDDVTANP
ncbi:MAG: anti-sigma factor family protein [Terriglobales bacterium]